MNQVAKLPDLYKLFKALKTKVGKTYSCTAFTEKGYTGKKSFDGKLTFAKVEICFTELSVAVRVCQAEDSVRFSVNQHPVNDLDDLLKHIYVLREDVKDIYITFAFTGFTSDFFELTDCPELSKEFTEIDVYNPPEEKGPYATHEICGHMYFAREPAELRRLRTYLKGLGLK